MKILLISILILLASVPDGILASKPLDCFVYDLTGSNFEGHDYYTFQGKLRFGFIVKTDEEWTLKLEVATSSGEAVCTISIINSNDSKRITSQCSDGQTSQSPTAASNEVNFLKIGTWNYFDLIQTESANGGSQIHLISTDLKGELLLLLKDTALEGQLRTRWLPGQVQMSYNYNCSPRCRLETYSSRIYRQESSSILLYFWRETGSSQLKFKYEHKDIHVPESSADYRSNNQWLVIKTNGDGSMISWTKLGFSNWGSIKLDPDAIRHFKNYGYEVEIPPDSLITRCHPLHLPCPFEPHKCSSHALESSFFLFIILGCSIIVIIVLVSVILMLLCQKTRNSKTGGLALQTMPAACPQPKENYYKRSPQPLPPNARKMDRSRSIDFDDFTSDHLYEEPLDISCPAETVYNMNTIKSSKSNRSGYDYREQPLYENL